ncbi:MAG: hypothetical protein AAF702_44705 [Chloroflexota bacterium]
METALLNLRSEFGVGKFDFITIGTTSLRSQTTLTQSDCYERRLLVYPRLGPDRMTPRSGGPSPPGPYGSWLPPSQLPPQQLSRNQGLGIVGCLRSLARVQIDERHAHLPQLRGQFISMDQFHQPLASLALSRGCSKQSAPNPTRLS